MWSYKKCISGTNIFLKLNLILFYLKIIYHEIHIPINSFFKNNFMLKRVIECIVYATKCFLKRKVISLIYKYALITYFVHHR